MLKFFEAPADDIELEAQKLDVFGNSSRLVGQSQMLSLICQRSHLSYSWSRFYVHGILGRAAW